MCFLALWLWVCFAGGIGALLSGDWELGLAATSAGLVTLTYLATPSRGGRWLIRAAAVLLWFLGGALLWSWTVEDWTVAGRIAFAALGGTALVAWFAYRVVKGSPEAGSRPGRGAGAGR